ncbi:hypothetical protein ACF06X_30325 [Streptomyces sp. NPDC015346]|uniref:hypothetical protein n=1 Tax=Streptomyces sp. NPDC015346 TaxID=3364954 RepID=UPI0036F98192
MGRHRQKPLEDQIDAVLRALKARAKEEEQARLAREAEQRRQCEERERQEEERRLREAQEEEEHRRRKAEKKERVRREWEAAISVAAIKAVDAVRVNRFGTALAQWRTAGEMRAFCAQRDSRSSLATTGTGCARP